MPFCWSQNRLYVKGKNSFQDHETFIDCDTHRNVCEKDLVFIFYILRLVRGNQLLNLLQNNRPRRIQLVTSQNL